MKKKVSSKLILVIASVVILATTFRAPIVAVGPVIPEMAEDLPLTPLLIGLIVAIPLMCFSFGSSFMAALSRKWGLENTLLYAILLLIVGLLVRPIGNLFYLFLGSALIGIGITIGNVLMPAFIKDRFPNRIGLVTAFYLLTMNATSALAVGFSISLGKVGHLGWKSSIGIWVLLALLSLFFWIPNLRKNSKIEADNHKKGENMWKSPLAWKISLYMGSQSVIFYVFATWLPTILQDWGMSAIEAGWTLSYFNAGQVPMVFIGPLLAEKAKSKSWPVWITFLTLLVGLLLILIWQTQFVLMASVLMGISVGLAFALATMFFVLRTKDVDDAAELSGMAQSVGYFIAACFPLLFGVFFSWTHSWEIPLLSLVLVAFLMIFTGIPSSRDQIIGLPTTSDIEGGEES